LIAEIRDAIKLLLSVWGKLPDVFSISCKDIGSILTGYYRFAGRILSITQYMFWIQTGLVGEEDRGGWD
jgi:hypothetical protein